MHLTRTAIACMALCLLCARSGDSQGVPVPSGFMALHNGKDFTGWEGNLEFFRIEEGAVVAGTLERRIPRNEFLCTRREYGDFELLLQARSESRRANGGIQVRSRRIPDHHEVEGYQVDVGHLRETNVWGSLYDESRRRRMLAVGEQPGVAAVFKAGDWNDFRILCQGKRIRIWLNGYPTVDYTEEDEGIERIGIIGLQIHSGPPGEIWYRNLVIRELPPED